MSNYDTDVVVQIECSCGAVFQPETIVTDRFGERCAVCPECGNKIRLGARDDF